MELGLFEEQRGIYLLDLNAQVMKMIDGGGALVLEDTPSMQRVLSRFEEWHSKPPKEHYLSMIGNTKGYWPGLLD